MSSLFNDHPQSSVGKEECVGEGEVGDRARASTFTEPLSNGGSLITVTICYKTSKKLICNFNVCCMPVKYYLRREIFSGYIDQHIIIYCI